MGNIKVIKGIHLLKSKTASEWKAANPVLMRGEAGIESDTPHWKVGDGVTAWNDLSYRSEWLASAAEVPQASNYPLGTHLYLTTTEKLYLLVSRSGNTDHWEQVALAKDLADLGAGDMLSSIYAKNAGAGAATGKVDHALKSDALATPRKIKSEGDATGSANFDGTADATLQLSLKELLAATQEGVQFPRLSVDKKGRITSIESMSVSDVTMALALGSAAFKEAGLAAGNIPVIGTDGKLNTSIMPALTITDVHTVGSQAEMLALTAQQGDICMRSDLSKVYILKNGDPTSLANWVEWLIPAGAVLSVNGKTGVVVLSTDDIKEGATSLYWTQSRFNTAFAAKSTDDLKEGATNRYFTAQRAKDATEEYLTDEANTFIFDGNID